MDKTLSDEIKRITTELAKARKRVTSLELERAHLMKALKQDRYSYRFIGEAFELRGTSAVVNAIKRVSKS